MQKRASDDNLVGLCVRFSCDITKNCAIKYVCSAAFLGARSCCSRPELHCTASTNLSEWSATLLQAWLTWEIIISPYSKGKGPLMMTLLCLLRVLCAWFCYIITENVANKSAAFLGGDLAAADQSNTLDLCLHCVQQFVWVECNIAAAWQACNFSRISINVAIIHPLHHHVGRQNIEPRGKNCYHILNHSFSINQ